MTIKTILFCLFLYVCLVWVGMGFLYPNDFVPHALLWTAIGLIAVLVLIIGAHLFGWWRLRRAKAASKPSPPPRPVEPVHPDDEALTALLAEANLALNKAPEFAAMRGEASFSKLPLYLIIGPEGAGKTSTLINSGMEPQLLAGQGVSPVASTRLCNLWLAKGAIFAEIGGRMFSGDLTRWNQLLRGLRGEVSAPLWKRLWREAAPQSDLRGVIAFCDVKEFISASSDPQRLERYCRDFQERLRSIAARFGGGIPVYVVVTKCDKIPFFLDFFRRVGESETNQVLGCTLPGQNQPSRQAEVFAEAEAKRLTASFRPLYHALARRRLRQLADEPNRAQRGGVYEFPREFKRIRSPLVQFLTDVFRPYALGPTLALRGYYLTGMRETEAPVADRAGGAMDWTSQGSMEATGLFRSDATQIFQRDDSSRPLEPAARKALSRRWMFVADLFHRVVLPDRPIQAPRVVEEQVERYRKLTFGALCGVSVLLCVTFLISWWNNRSLLSDVDLAVANQPARPSQETSISDLTKLDALRLRIVKLEGPMPLRFHWGLYSGDGVLDQLRSAYFRQFQRLLLTDMNGQMVADLQGLPQVPAPGSPYLPAYQTLKLHRMISSAGCTPEAPFVARGLKEVRARVAPSARPEWQELADRQIDFYASELARGYPLHVTEDAGARDRARQYLSQIHGLDRLYLNIKTNAEKSLKNGSHLADLAPNYAQVLKGVNEVNPVFSQAGWVLIEKASKETDRSALGEPCVLGTASGALAGWKQNNETAQAIQRMYLREYVDAWRKFVESISVAEFTGPADAANKLEILADHRSPLLAVLFLGAKQTDFPVPSKDPGVLEKVKKVVPGVKLPVNPAPEPPDSLNSTADIPKFFQPVQAIEPPGSDTLVGEKLGPYIDSLVQLRRSMLDIAQNSGEPDMAVHQLARANYEKGMEVVGQLTRGFKPVGHIDVTVQSLLAQPIRYTERFIKKPTDPIKDSVENANRDLRTFCTSQAAVFSKYPFTQTTDQDVALDKFTAVFQPEKGTIWQFQQKSLADFVVKDGSQWKSKDPAKKPQPTQELLRFLNRAQSVADGFYQGGATQPHLEFEVRPILDPRMKDYSLELEIDGQAHPLGILRTLLRWPSPQATKDVGTEARLLGQNLSVTISTWPGVWGMFRVFGDAEPRELNSKYIVWTHTGSGRGRTGEIKPAPVRLEISSFPGGQDVFNAKLWEGLQCPKAALQ